MIGVATVGVSRRHSIAQPECGERQAPDVLETEDAEVSGMHCVIRPVSAAGRLGGRPLGDCSPRDAQPGGPLAVPNTAVIENAPNLSVCRPSKRSFGACRAVFRAKVLSGSGQTETGRVSASTIR
jgi:hypothetical protein